MVIVTLAGYPVTVTPGYSVKLTVSNTYSPAATSCGAQPTLQVQFAILCLPRRRASRTADCVSRATVCDRATAARTGATGRVTAVSGLLVCHAATSSITARIENMSERFMVFMFLLTPLYASCCRYPAKEACRRTSSERPDLPGTRTIGTSISGYSSSSSSSSLSAIDVPTGIVVMGNSFS